MFVIFQFPDIITQIKNTHIDIRDHYNQARINTFKTA